MPIATAADWGAAADTLGAIIDMLQDLDGNYPAQDNGLRTIREATDHLIGAQMDARATAARLHGDADALDGDLEGLDGGGPHGAGRLDTLGAMLADLNALLNEWPSDDQEGRDALTRGYDEILTARFCAPRRQPETDALSAARAAYRIGLLDAMLHPDTRKALAMPGAIEEAFRGERNHRLGELASAGIGTDELADMRLA